MVNKWETVSQRKAGRFRIFDIELVRRINPSSSVEGEFVVLKLGNWVNIIPITTNNEVVMIEQYRHGVDEVTLEIPGGLIERGEDPRLAGERECAEETGFASNINSELLGFNQPNPAFLNNTCYSYLWRDCSEIYVQKLDIHEDIKVRLIPVSDIKQMILSGEIRHSLVLNAFFYYFLKYKVI